MVETHTIANKVEYILWLLWRGWDRIGNKQYAKAQTYYRERQTNNQFYLSLHIILFFCFNLYFFR
jgi:hypothetical protein